MRDYFFEERDDIALTLLPSCLTALERIDRIIFSMSSEGCGENSNDSKAGNLV